MRLPMNESGHVLGNATGFRTCDSRAFVTALHTSLKYFSRYFGNKVAKDDSSMKAPALLSSGLKGSIFHYTQRMSG